MVGRIIETDACVAEGTAWLAAREPRFAQVLQLTGPPPLRRWPDGFGALLNAIAGQQISVASAAAVLDRLRAAGLTEPEPILQAGEEGLRANGLTRQKAAYVHALARAGLDYAALRRAPDEDVIQILIAQKGIGRWTAEIYAMFALGRADVIAAGDLAIQEAARAIFDLPTRPSDPEMREMAKAWSPWRAVAARLLWAYYQHDKSREGVL